MDKPFIILLGIAIVAVLVGAFVIAPRVGPEPTPTPSPSASPVVGESREYSSEALGISFQYIPQQTGDVSFLVQEVGDRIYVYRSGTNPEAGQFVETFQKNEDETFKDSIQRQILAGFTGDCTVELARSNIYSGGWIAEISYPRPANEEEAWFANAEQCNAKYAKANGIRYFLYDEDFPDRFYYFDIGQYSIFGRGETPWQYTIELF